MSDDATRWVHFEGWTSGRRPKEMSSMARVVFRGEEVPLWSVPPGCQIGVEGLAARVGSTPTLKETFSVRVSGEDLDARHLAALLRIALDLPGLDVIVERVVEETT